MQYDPNQPNPYAAPQAPQAPPGYPPGYAAPPQPPQAPPGYPQGFAPPQAPGYPQGFAPPPAPAYPQPTPQGFAPPQAPQGYVYGHTPPAPPAVNGDAFAAMQAKIMAASGGGGGNPRPPYGTHLIEMVKIAKTEQSKNLIAFDFKIVASTDAPNAVGVVHGILQGVGGGDAGSEAAQNNAMLGYVLPLEGYPTKEHAAQAGALPEIARKIAITMAAASGWPLPADQAPPPGGFWVGRRAVLICSPGTKAPKAGKNNGKPYDNWKFAPAQA
jgi:hypothetical protein